MKNNLNHTSLNISFFFCQLSASHAQNFHIHTIHFRISKNIRTANGCETYFFITQCNRMSTQNLYRSAERFTLINLGIFFCMVHSPWKILGSRIHFLNCKQWILCLGVWPSLSFIPLFCALMVKPIADVAVVREMNFLMWPGSSSDQSHILDSRASGRLRFHPHFIYKQIIYIYYCVFKADTHPGKFLGTGSEWSQRTMAATKYFT